MPFNDLTLVYINNGLKFLIVDVKVGRTMLFWCKVHPDDDAEEHGERRHTTPPNRA
jgi:hypothetical protein